MQNRIRIALTVSVTVLIIALIASAVFNRALKKSLPEYEGEVYAQNIKDNIDIYRDSAAIPYIVAKNDEDAAFGLGYLHAQERLFQMDLLRRSAEGRLSEVFGTRTLPFDEMFLTVGIKRFAQESISKLNPEALKILKAYSNGVNEYIHSQKGKYPVEFDVLGYEPYDWKPEHSLMIIRMMAWNLNLSWWTDFAFIKLVKSLGEEKVKEIYPDYPENAPFIVPSSNEVKDINTSMAEVDKNFREFIGSSGSHIGSNNWVVDGKKSVSGKPIIANDPHLGFNMPGFWYAAVIKAPNWDAAGVTLPGTPCIAIGKNNNISWVFTNVMADDADFYQETLDAKKQKYFCDNEWHDLKKIREVIKVKDSSDVAIEIKLTHRGPLIDAVHPFNIVYKGDENKVKFVSMRWTGNDFSDELYSLIRINKAQNFGEFKQAVQNFSVPGQNFVYGDKQGNIGYVFGARLPLRDNSSPTMIFDGSSSKNDWKGFVPFNEVPVLYNPGEDFIATANNKTVADFRYHISNIWEPSSRIVRIKELLRSKDKHSVNDFMNYQMDQFSPYAREITKEILSAFEGISIKDPNLKLTLDLLAKWDCNIDKGSQSAAIYEVFLTQFFQNVFLDKMGSSLYNDFVTVANLPYRSIVKLMANPNSDWFDIKKTQVREDKKANIRKSMADALSFLENRMGDNLTYWQWGSLHKGLFKHTFASTSSFVDKKVNIGPFELGGDGTTIFNTEYSFNTEKTGSTAFDHEPFEGYLGPSMRFVYDFANPDEFYLVLTSGQSGNILSPHYKDQFEMWLTGKYLKINTNIESIKRNKVLTILKQS